MPPDDRIWLDDGEVAAPVGEEARQNCPESSIGWLQSWPFGISLKNLELMAEGDVLEGELISGIQAGDDGAKIILNIRLCYTRGVVTATGTRRTEYLGGTGLKKNPHTPIGMRG